MTFVLLLIHVLSAMAPLTTFDTFVIEVTHFYCKIEKLFKSQ